MGNCSTCAAVRAAAEAVELERQAKLTPEELAREKTMAEARAIYAEAEEKVRAEISVLRAEAMVKVDADMVLATEKAVASAKVALDVAVFAAASIAEPEEAG